MGPHQSVGGGEIPGMAPAPLENKKIEGKLYFSYNIYEMSFSVLDLWHS